MLSVRVVKSRRGNQSNLIRWVFKAVVLVLSVVLAVYLVLRFYSEPIKALAKTSIISSQNSKITAKKPDGSCLEKKSCPNEQFSFFLQSGAANVVPAKICINNKLMVGTVLNNVGIGINVVKLNGRTGEVLRIEHFNMYDGKIEAFVEFLKNIETGSVVLMASYDEPSTKLTDEARKLISDLGSSAIQTLGYRDSWVFVGGKGTSVKSGFEKHMKNDQAKNKYKDWPELVQLDGCIPKYME
ncbi:protein FAM3C [Kryptolebias marmoratus]|uniref:Protein FAM3C-like n=1 Tax=Kryptolebias marmoratus TaxID=37003 RepID=A0A3Q2ZZC8_KRYMA|nr:protein FAM3C [Kryptolebias marmoratus]